jgi:hypothetical protein
MSYEEITARIGNLQQTSRDAMDSSVRLAVHTELDVFYLISYILQIRI